MLFELAQFIPCGILIERVGKKQVRSCYVANRFFFNLKFGAITEREILRWFIHAVCDYRVKKNNALCKNSRIDNFPLRERTWNLLLIGLSTT